MKNKKTKILSVIAITTFMLLLIGATYAYFTAQGGDPTSANLNVTTYTTDVFTFTTGSDINIYADQSTFASGKGNATGSTFARATLTANNKTNTATDHYNVYFNISDNNFKYSVNTSTPELLLTIKDANNNEVTSITGLEHKTVTDGKGASISGFDITTKIGLLTLIDNREITASPSKVETWNITITFVNYNRDQSSNMGKSFDGQVLISKDSFNEYTPNTINTLSTTKSGNNLTVNLAVDEGTNTISKYYYAIEETNELAMLNNKPQVMRLSNTLAANTLTYVESESSSYTFSNINSLSNYNIYAYAVDNKKIKTNTYEYKYLSDYDLPWVKSVSISKSSNSLTVTLTAVKGTNNVSKYYYSIDNGNTYIESTSNSYTFNDLSTGIYNLYFYVEDTAGKRSNKYVKGYNFNPMPEPEKNHIAERGTVTTIDGEVIEISDSYSMENYLSVLVSATQPETITGYIKLAVIEVNFIDIVSADTILYVPGVKEGDTIIVKRYDSGSWTEVDSQVVGDNQIRVNFTQADIYEILRKQVN